LKESLFCKVIIIDLISLKSSPLAFEFLLEPSEIDLEGENIKLKSTVKTEGELTRRIAQIDAEGEISGEAEMECSRCLSPIEKILEIPFSVGFVTPEYYTEQKEAELNADDLDITIVEDEKIDLSELGREQILLNLPEQVYCQEDCQGLCQKCGANRNLIDCKCIEKEVDPRWAALKNLK
jgi:uncharacterized protein